jgi:hypothetical protein
MVLDGKVVQWLEKPRLQFRLALPHCCSPGAAHSILAAEAWKYRPLALTKNSRVKRLLPGGSKRGSAPGMVSTMKE